MIVVTVFKQHAVVFTGTCHNIRLMDGKGIVNVTMIKGVQEDGCVKDLRSII